MNESQRRKRRRQLAVFVTASTAMSFLVGEASIRVMSRFADIYDLEMHKYAVQLKKSSDNPLLSHEHIPNSQARLMGVDVSLNALGHRNGDLPLPKPDNQRRIHVIGSSMCLGWGAPQEQTFTSQLERNLNEIYSELPRGDQIRVINAGVGNTNTQNYVELFKLQYQLTKPDTVIMQYFINDSEVIGKKSHGSVYKYSLFLAILKQKLSAMAFALLGSQSLADYYLELYDDDAPGWKTVQESVRELKELTEQENMQLVILLIPDLHNLSKNSPLIPVYDQVASTFRKMGIDTIDIFSELTQRYGNDPQQAWVAPQDPHPNAAVHSIIASRLTAYLTSPGEERLASALIHAGTNTPPLATGEGWKTDVMSHRLGKLKPSPTTR